MLIQKNGKKRYGTVLPMLAISLVAIMGFVALAIDLGVLAISRVQIQNAADIAALTGVRELNGSPTTTASTNWPNQNGAYNSGNVAPAATTAAYANNILGNPPGSVAVLVGCYGYSNTAQSFTTTWPSGVTSFGTSGSQTSGSSILASNATLPSGTAYSLTAVQATVTSSTNATFFAKAFGMSFFPTVSATASAVMRPRDFALVMDFSGSMVFGSQLGYSPYFTGNRSRSNNADTTYPTFGAYSSSNASLQYTGTGATLNDNPYYYWISPGNLTYQDPNDPPRSPICLDFYSTSAGVTPKMRAFTSETLIPTGTTSTGEPSGIWQMPQSGTATPLIPGSQPADPSGFTGTWTGSSGSPGNTISVSSTSGLTVGQTLSGSGLPSGTVITSIDSTTNSITVGTNTNTTPLTSSGTGVSVSSTNGIGGWNSNTTPQGPTSAGIAVAATPIGDQWLSGATVAAITGSSTYNANWERDGYDYYYSSNSLSGATIYPSSVAAYTALSNNSTTNSNITAASYTSPNSYFQGYTQGPTFWGKSFFIWPPDPRFALNAANDPGNYYLQMYVSDLGLDVTNTTNQKLWTANASNTNSTWPWPDDNGLSLSTWLLATTFKTNSNYSGGAGQSITLATSSAIYQGIMRIYSRQYMIDDRGGTPADWRRRFFTGWSATSNTTTSNYTFTGTVTYGSNQITSVSSTANLSVGQSLSGSYIGSGATISGISGNTVTMSRNSTFSFRNRGNSPYTGTITATSSTTTTGAAIPQNSGGLFDGSGNLNINQTINYDEILYWIKNCGPNPFASEMHGGNITFYTAIPTSLNSVSGINDANNNGVMTYDSTGDLNQCFWKQYIDYAMGWWAGSNNWANEGYGPGFTYGSATTSTANAPTGSGTAVVADVPYMGYSDSPLRPNTQFWFGPMTMVDFLQNTSNGYYNNYPGDCHESPTYSLKVGVQAALTDMQQNQPNDAMSVIFYAWPFTSGRNYGRFNAARSPLGTGYNYAISALYYPQVTLTTAGLLANSQYDNVSGTTWSLGSSFTSGYSSAKGEIHMYDANYINDSPHGYNGTTFAMGMMLAYNQFLSTDPSDGTLRSYVTSSPYPSGLAGGMGRTGAQKVVIFETDGIVDDAASATLVSASAVGSTPAYKYYPIRYDPGNSSRQELPGYSGNGSSDPWGVYKVIDQTQQTFGSSRKPVRLFALAFGPIYGSTLTDATTGQNTLCQMQSTLPGSTAGTSNASATATMVPSSGLLPTSQLITGTDSQMEANLQSALNTIMQGALQCALVQ